MKNLKRNVFGNQNLETSLSQIVSHRFGKNLQILPYFNAIRSFQEDDLVIPLEHENISMAQVVVRDGRSLPLSLQKEIESLIHIYARGLNIEIDEEHSSMVNTIETPVATQDTDTAGSGNLITSRPFPGQEQWIDAEDLNLPHFTFVDLPVGYSEFTNYGFILKTKNEQLFNKLSALLHEKTDRWALLRWDDVKSSIKSFSDILSMGPLTLVVNDLDSLLEQEREILRSALLLTSEPNKPIFIFHDRDNDLFDTSLFKDLPVSFITASQLPQDNLRLEEVLDLILSFPKVSSEI